MSIIFRSLFICIQISIIFAARKEWRNPGKAYVQQWTKQADGWMGYEPCEPCSELMLKNSTPVVATLLFRTVGVATRVDFGTATPPQKCILTDTACVLKSAQTFAPYLAAGIPESGTEPLDVMKVDEIKIDLAGLLMNMRDVEIKGLKKVLIDSLNVDMKKKQINLVYHSDINMRGQYKASGRLLILPISGDGEAVIKLKNLQTDITIPFSIVKNGDGKDVMELGSYKYKYDLKDGAHFNFTNLFNGNKILSGPMINFMNENWKILMDGFGRPFLDTPVKKVFSAIKVYLKSQPLEDIAIY